MTNVSRRLLLSSTALLVLAACVGEFDQEEWNAHQDATGELTVCDEDGTDAAVAGYIASASPKVAMVGANHDESKSSNGCFITTTARRADKTPMHGMDEIDEIVDRTMSRCFAAGWPTCWVVYLNEDLTSPPDADAVTDASIARLQAKYDAEQAAKQAAEEKRRSVNPPKYLYLVCEGKTTYPGLNGMETARQTTIENYLIAVANSYLKEKNDIALSTEMSGHLEMTDGMITITFDNDYGTSINREEWVLASLGWRGAATDQTQLRGRRSTA